MTNQQLVEIRNQLLEQDTYEKFEQMLLQQEPFKPTYVKPVSRQSSSNYTHFGGNYSS